MLPNIYVRYSDKPSCFALARGSWLWILAWFASGSCSWLSASNPGLIRVWLQVFRQNVSSRFPRKFKFKFCSRYSNKIFLRASCESLSLSSIFQLFPVSRFMSYQGIQMAHLAKHWCKVFRECILPNIYVRHSDNTSCQTFAYYQHVQTFQFHPLGRGQAFRSWNLVYS